MLAAPATLLPLGAAFRLWSLAQLALLAGWGGRRRLAGAAAAALGMVATSLALAGPPACAGFAAAALGSTGRWPLGSLLGVSGLLGSWFGDGRGVELAAAAGTAVACAGCAVLGRRLRRGRAGLEPALAGATALSLLAAPHLLGHDLVLLAPMLPAVLGWSLARPRPGQPAIPAVAAVLALWTALAAASWLDLGAAGVGPPGRLVPWVLAALGAAALTTTRPARARRARAAPRPVPRGEAG